MTSPAENLAPQAGALAEHYRRVRATSLDLVRDLQPEDTVVQTMPDVSPTKWHLAHVTWFFECFVLRAYRHGLGPARAVALDSDSAAGG